MLLGEYFTIQNSKEEENKAIFSISLNPNHKIYKGHFPQMPVSPGVCNIQVIKECLQQQVGKKLLLKSILQVKFLSLIVPSMNENLCVSMLITETEEKSYKIKATITNPENMQSFVDFRGEFQYSGISI
jgi:3-hydroxyacyl-[acyl-carrier-protein] dehydratase